MGEPYVDRIREAMMPHLFADDRPPAVLLAALGDLGGAVGAALAAKGSKPRNSPPAKLSGETQGRERSAVRP
jgi:hypothetical protein